MNSPKKIRKYLSNSSNEFENLITRALEISHLNAKLHSILDKSFKNHCDIANFRDATLIILTDSPAWLTRLRYQIPSLLKQLQQLPDFKGISQIKLRIQPKYVERKKRQLRREPISNLAASCLTTLADSVQDSELKTVLQQLASRSKTDHD
ncbi:hypothetical protein MNBD_GAMMA22-1446 [hydrothermal vent metagenome]|uniref:Zn-ribbon-containing, possibly RNA-binding protein and truncated derivatives n=1 Tax=hydrothermal vent metagenome TaxID=652676 RepID=A0A3B1A4Z5_9ZZZZ